MALAWANKKRPQFDTLVLSTDREGEGDDEGAGGLAGRTATRKKKKPTYFDPSEDPVPKPPKKRNRVMPKVLKGTANNQVMLVPVGPGHHAFEGALLRTEPEVARSTKNQDLLKAKYNESVENSLKTGRPPMKLSAVSLKNNAKKDLQADVVAAKKAKLGEEIKMPVIERSRSNIGPVDNAAARTKVNTNL